MRDVLATILILVCVAVGFAGASWWLVFLFAALSTWWYLSGRAAFQWGRAREEGYAISLLLTASITQLVLFSIIFALGRGIGWLFK
ncbi:hypothetical protein BKD02_01640 [Brucella sp. 09RB8910]|nr:hypothetical protein BKD02_01640 [Brucella sp. 09RB8910]